VIGEITIDHHSDAHDARAWFNRAIDMNDRAGLADWAAKYGRSLCDLADNAIASENGEDIDDIKEELEAEIDANREISKLVTEALTALQSFTREHATPETLDALRAISKTLTEASSK
jgi:hypothetical protein